MQAQSENKTSDSDIKFVSFLHFSIKGSKTSKREMLLRSSSTPILGSRLSSFSESPNHHLSEPHHSLKHPTPPPHHQHKPPLLLNCSSASSPLSHSLLESSGKTFKRSNSEGNLAELADEQFCNYPVPRPQKCNQRRLSGPFLETIPSFSFHSTAKHEDDSDDDDMDEDFGNISLSLEDFGSDNNGKKFLNAYKSFGLVEEQAQSGEMYLARGLGVENLNIGFGGGNGGGGDFIPLGYGRDGGDGKRQGAEEHYKNLVEENPGNPLFLRNYAQFLFETKRDLAKSEELYSRAILADPGDGEVLSQYAKLIWELHRDEDRALNYYERAVQAAPADSHVHAAYANFLWEIEGDEEEEEDDNSLYSSSIFNSHIRKGVFASAST